MTRSATDLARRVILLVLAGAVVSGHLFYLSESFLPLGIPHLAASILATCIVPWTFAAIVFYAGRKRQAGSPTTSSGSGMGDRPDAPAADAPQPTIVSGFKSLDWLFLAAVTFGLWAGGYFLVGLVTSGRPMRHLGIGLDATIPLSPEFVWCYLTIYPMFLIPFFLVPDRRTAKSVVISYVVILLVSYAFFLAFPVEYARPALPSDGSFSVFALSVVYGADPAWNCFPSTHCAMALLSALVILENLGLSGAWGLVVALSIGVSTLFTKQHYLVDVIAGWGLTLAVYLPFFRGKLGARIRRPAVGLRAAGPSTSSSGT